MCQSIFAQPKLWNVARGINDRDGLQSILKLVSLLDVKTGEGTVLSGGLDAVQCTITSVVGTWSLQRRSFSFPPETLIFDTCATHYFTHSSYSNCRQVVRCANPVNCEERQYGRRSETSANHRKQLTLHAAMRTVAVRALRNARLGSRTARPALRGYATVKPPNKVCCRQWNS